MNEPTLLLKVPAQNGKTDFWETQIDAMRLLRKAGVKESRWHHGSGSDQYCCGKFTNEQLTWLGLYGCEITKNLTEVYTQSVRDKINQTLSTLKFTDAEQREVDIVSVFVQSINELLGVKE
jgi:hypothetical protein